MNYLYKLYTVYIVTISQKVLGYFKYNKYLYQLIFSFTINIYYTGIIDYFDYK